MKKRTGLVTLIATIAMTGALTHGSSTTAFAQDGAIVLKGIGCGIEVSPAGTPIEAVFTSDAQAIVTPDGNEALVCRAMLPDGIRPAQTTVIKNIPCGIVNQSTEISHTVITKSGQVILTCHAH